VSVQLNDVGDVLEPYEHCQRDYGGADGLLDSVHGPIAGLQRPGCCLSHDMMLDGHCVHLAWSIFLVAAVKVPNVERGGTRHGWNGSDHDRKDNYEVEGG
jgi:hypothetical protein